MPSTINADNGVISGVTGVRTTADNTGNLALQSNGNTILTLNTSNVASFTGSVNTPNTFGFKNRIINGAMMIDQRNSGASVTPSSGTSSYVLDRYQCVYSQPSKFSVQQNAGSVTPPTGFINYMGITSLSAYSNSGEIFSVQQRIEGLNVPDLAWGTSSAKTVTLSMWVYSSLTGTFGGSIANSAQNRSYPYTYTVSSANTWTQVSVVIPGDTTGTWLTTSGVGVIVNFNLGSGSTFAGTAGSWAAADYRTATGANSIIGTNGATFYITGVQFEIGSQATSFDLRSYGTELNLCQRYYQQILGSGFFASGVAISGGQVRGPRLTLFQTMRATPTIGLPTAGTGSGQVYYCTSGGSAASIGSISAQQIKQDSFFMECEGFNGLSAGNGSLLSSGGGNATFTISAEL